MTDWTATARALSDRDPAGPRLYRPARGNDLRRDRWRRSCETFLIGRRIGSESFTCHIAGGRSRPSGPGSYAMTTYLISSDAHAMDHVSAEGMPVVAEAAHAVARQALNAGVLLCTGIIDNQQAGIVTTDGTVTDGPCPETIAGVMVVEVPSRRRRCSGRLGSQSLAAARKRSGSSCPTPTPRSARCSARQAVGGDLSVASDRTPAHDLPRPRPDGAGLNWARAVPGLTGSAPARSQSTRVPPPGWPGPGSRIALVSRVIATADSRPASAR